MASPGPAEDSPSDKFEEKLQQRAAAVRKPLEMSSPARDDQRNYYGGHFPNTPLAAATIAFMLGGVFMWGLKTFAAGGYPLSTWMTYQLGFFVASWAAFHFGEFAVTAGWNRDRCNVDCKSSVLCYHILVC
jgi:protein-S-isoprenylcysteine O-methyltransferase